MATTWAGYDRGDREFNLIILGLFAAGFATFALIFGPQALLPVVSGEYGIGTAAASMLISAAALAVAVSVIPWSIAADRFGRTNVMKASLISSVMIGALVPWVDDFAAVVALRAMLGLTLGAVPAVAIAYLNEELIRGRVTLAAGVYIAGNTVGGIVARLVAGFVGETWDSAVAFAALDAIAIVAAVTFVLIIPVPRGFVGLTRQPYRLLTRLAIHLRDPVMLALYAQGFLIMGCFAAVYNVLGYRLIGDPLNVPAQWASFVFLAYFAGSVSSQYSGVLVNRFGIVRVILIGAVGMLIGLMLLGNTRLPVVVAGLLVFTSGCFLIHPTASGQTGQQALIGRAQGTALFQLSWLLGTAVWGAIAGSVYDSFGWRGATFVWLTQVVVAAVIAGVGLTWGMRHRPAPPAPQSAT